MSNGMILAGRFLLGLYFLVPGLMKFAAPEMHVALMEAHNVSMAEPLMWIAAGTKVAGGLALIFGRHVRLVAIGFVVYIMLVNLQKSNVAQAVANNVFITFFKLLL